MVCYKINNQFFNLYEVVTKYKLRKRDEVDW